MKFEEGHMYRVEDGQPIEYIRWGDQLLPEYHPLLKEVIGQLILELE